MRSISQTFADHLLAREFDVAKILIRKHGANKTSAHLWMATHLWRGEDKEVELLETIGSANLTVQDWNDVYLRRLAMRGSENGNDPILDWLNDKVDFQLLDERAVIHHACYHNRHEILDLLEDKIKAGGKEVNWNDDRKGLGTPLFIALKEGHEDTILALIRKGAEGSIPISSGLKGVGKAKTVIEAGVLTGPDQIAETYRKAKRRASLEQVALKAGKMVGRGMKKIGVKM